MSPILSFPAELPALAKDAMGRESIFSQQSLIFTNWIPFPRRAVARLAGDDTE